MKKLNIHFLQHVSIEGLGSIEDWIISKGHHLTSTQLYENTNFPELDEIDCLIIMGGPMSVYEENKYQWLILEKKFIRQAIDKGKIVLGICLGSQLIADVLGARVYPNKFKEIGWFPVKMTMDAAHSRLFKFFPKQLTVFQWHGDTFDIPAEAIHIATSEACNNQAFVFNDKVVALQFHFETNLEDIDEMVNNFSNELVKSKYVQTAYEIAGGKKYIKANTDYMNNILDELERMNFNQK